MVYKRVRGWTSGRSLPVLNFVKDPPGSNGATLPKMPPYMTHEVNVLFINTRGKTVD